MTKSGQGRFLAGTLLGVVIGVIAGVGLTTSYLAFKTSRTWIDAGAVWMRLPSQTEAGVAPQIIAIPAKAYDYGAETRSLDTAITDGPALLRVQLGAVQGSVGVSLAKPDGSALISKEHPVTAKDSGKTLYFRISGAEGLVSVLVRNYAAEGQSGSVAVQSVAYTPAASLSKDQMSAINRVGVY